MTVGQPHLPPRSLVEFILEHAGIETLTCSRQALQTGYRLKRRTMSDYNLIFVTAGRVVWVIDDEQVPLWPGRLVIVPPKVAHHAYSTTRRVRLFSYHTLVTLPGGSDAFELLTPPRVQQVARGNRLDRYLRGAAREFQRADPRHRQLMLSAWVRLIVLELIRSNAEAGLMHHRVVEPMVTAMLDTLNERVGRPTTLNDLSALSGYSPQHLNRLFQRVLGMTPLQYLVRLRMQRAGVMLAEDRLTINAIAAQVGYDDPYYFSRLFKQHTGRSPSQWRGDVCSDSPS